MGKKNDVQYVLLLNSENRSCNGVTSFQTLEKLEMKLNRKIVKKFNTGEEADEGYVHAEKNELISMIWEITIIRKTNKK
jgi:hypothetical protein